MWTFNDLFAACFHVKTVGCNDHFSSSSLEFISILFQTYRGWQTSGHRALAYKLNKHFLCLHLQALAGLDHKHNT